MNIDFVKALEKKGNILNIPAGKIIFQEGDLCNNFVLVKSGKIKVFKNSEQGRELVLYRVSPEQLCVLTTSCILSNTSYTANGMTETDVVAIAIDKPTFDNLIVESLEFRTLVFNSLSNRFNSFVEKIDEVVFHTLKQRLLDFIIKNKDQNNIIHLTHQNLASELGTEREVISRLLNQLKKQERVSLQKGSITFIK